MFELGAHGVDGFEGVVLKDFLADFIPEIFLRVKLRRIGRQEEQRDIVWKREVAAAMVGGAVEHQENILPGKLSREDVEEGLEARRIRCWHDQIDASPVLRTDRAVQVDVFANSWEATSGLVPIGAQHGRGRLIRPNRASSVNMIRKQRPRRAAARRAFLTAFGKPFF